MDGWTASSDSSRTSASRSAGINTLRIAIAGAGRMAQAIASRSAGMPNVELAGVWTRDPERVRDAFARGTHLDTDIDALARAADVLVDFSLPDGSRMAAQAAARSGRALVSGVSGLGETQFAALRQAADVVPVVYDRNMSQGIAVLASIVEKAAASLGDEFAVTIEETHHVHKRDAPSGTALKLGEAVAAARGTPLEELMWYEREGDAPEGAIHFSVERRGEVPGDHSVSFVSAFESLSFRHSVASRDVFAEGALRACAWVVGQKAGLYSMSDVLGLTDPKEISN